MNYTIKFSALLFILFLSACKTEKTNIKEKGSSTKENLYFGQKPPGLIPEVFAPGIISTEYLEACGVFTPDMKEFYLMRRGGKYEKRSLVVFQNKNNQWYESLVSSSVNRPSISPDGKTIHLGKQYIERTEAGLSEVKKLDVPSFEDIRIMRLSASAKGTYYFDEYDSIGAIRYSRLIDGKREKPQKMSKEINRGKWIGHPFIAPDESYLIWDAERDSGFGDSDIYISFRQQDGSWGEAINMGDKINTSAWDAYPSVTPDGKYLFFHRKIGPENNDIFWVDAKVIETLRTQ